MSLNDKKIKLIELLLATTDITILNQVSNLLAQGKNNLSDDIETMSEPTSKAITNTNISVEAVKNLDNLITQNMPELGKSLSIEEIRAMAAEAEAKLSN